MRFFTGAPSHRIRESRSSLRSYRQSLRTRLRALAFVNSYRAPPCAKIGQRSILLRLAVNVRTPLCAPRFAGDAKESGGSVADRTAKTIRTAAYETRGYFLVRHATRLLATRKRAGRVTEPYCLLHEPSEQPALAGVGVSTRFASTLLPDDLLKPEALPFFLTSPGLRPNSLLLFSSLTQTRSRVKLFLQEVLGQR
jgi:hypothetical protein